MAEPIGALRVELSTSIAKFEADLGKARQAARNFSTGVNKSLKDMGGGFGGLGSQIGKMAASFAIATVAVNAISSAIRGTIGFIKDSISASAAQTTQEKTLAKAIENTGVSYASVRDEINKTLVTIQRSTKFADDEQRPVLQTLIALTGDYKTSLKALPVVLDASVALQQDAKTTALLFAKAIAGNISSLSRYGITLDETTQKLIKQATPAKALELLTKALGDRWKGLAESEAAAFEGQLIQLTNAWGDLKETIGDFITKSPQVQDAINKIEDRIFKWIDAIESNEETQQKFNEFLDNAITLMESLATAIPKVVNEFKSFFNILSEIKFLVDNFNLESLSKALDFGSIGELFTTTPGDILNKFKEQVKVMEDAQKQVEFYDKSLQNLAIPLGVDVDRLDDLGLVLGNATEKTAGLTEVTEKYTEAAKKGKSAVEQLNDSFKKQVETLERQVATFGLTAEQIIEFDRQLAISKGVIPEVANRVADLSLELNDLAEEAKATAEAWEELFSMDEEIDALQEELDQIDFQTFIDKTEPQLDSFTQFVGSAFANMGQDIGDAIVNAGNVWEAVINSMKRIVADLIGFLIANPIRLLFEGGTSGGADIFSGAKNIFSTGFSAITDIFKGVFSGAGEFFSLIGKAIPLFGAIASVVTVGISAILKLFEKAPEVHIDIGRFNTEIDDRFAFVKDFIELSDDVNSDLAKDLVTIKKGKIGIDNTELRQIIFDKINAVISGIQDMLSQLPADLSKTLKEVLLNTQLIDFDEATKRIIGIDYTGKEARKRLEQFLSSGELEAEFVASISPFFEEFYKQIGVLPDAALRIVDEFKTAFAGASPEEQVILGQEFLAQMQAYIDAFNILNDYAADSFQVAINQIEALSADLGITEEGIPSLDQIKEVLQELFDTGELTPEIVEKFKALKGAVEIFNQVVDDMFNKITQFGKGPLQVSINEIQRLTEELEIQARSGIPTFEELEKALYDLLGTTDITREALQELVEAGLITPDIVDKFFALKDAIEVFDDVVDDMYDKISQFGKGAIQNALDGIREMTEELGIQTEQYQSGIPSLKQINDALFDLIGTTDITKEAFRELVETGQITPEVVDKFIALRQAIMDLSFTLASSIQTILSTIQQLNQQIFDLGGDIVPTSDYIRDQIAILMDMLNQEGLSTEERLAILDQLNQLTNDLNAAFIQENTLQRERIENAQKMISAITNEIAAVNASIEALRIQKEQIKENFKLQIDALEEEKKLISEIAEERISGLEAEKSAIESAFGLKEESKFALVEELNKLKELRSQIESDYDARIELARQVAEEEKRLIQEVFGEMMSALEAEKSALESAFDLGKEQEFALIAQLKGLQDLKPQIEETFRARRDALEKEKQLVNEIFRDRLSALEAEKSAIQSAFSLGQEEQNALIKQLNVLKDLNTASLERVNILKAEQSAIEAAFSLKKEEENVLIARLKGLQELRAQVETDFNERIKLAEEENKNQINSQKGRFKLSIDTINTEIDALNDLFRIAERFQDLIGTIADDILKVTLVGKVPEQQIGIIRSLIALEESMLNTLQGEAKLDSLSRLRELNLKLFEATQAGFQEPSLDFQALQTEVLRNLEDLQNLAEEEAARAEDLQLRIASLNEQIVSINSRIEANTDSISKEVERLTSQQEQQLAQIDDQIAALTLEAQERIKELIVEQTAGLKEIDDQIAALTAEAQERLKEINSQLAQLAGQEAAALAAIDAQIAKLAGEEAKALQSIDNQIVELTAVAQERLEEINLELEKLAEEEAAALAAIDEQIAKLEVEQLRALTEIDRQIAALTFTAQQRLEEVVSELEQLRQEEADALKAIDEQIAELEAAQTAALQSIDAQIAQANQHLVALNAQLAAQQAILTQQAQLTTEQQAELLELFEFLREMELLALEERIQQQAELMGLATATFEVEVEQAILLTKIMVLQEQLASLGMETFGVNIQQTNLLSQIRDLMSNIPNQFQSFQHGGLVKETGLKLLHAGEFVLPSDFNGGSTRNVNIAVNVNGNIPSNPTAISMLSDSLVSKIKEEIVEDMEYGKLGKVTVRRVGLA